MAVGEPSESEPRDKDIDVLWVNNIRSVKRPEWFLRLARALPAYNFTLVGGPMPHESEQYRQLQREAKSVTNLELAGPVPYEAVNAYYSRARLFVNTSTVEGFPNSFLQAWIRGVPVVSTFDPDNLISQRGLGQFVQTESELKAAALRFLENDQLTTTCGYRASAYAYETHESSQLGRLLFKFINNL
jgi:glycosyltransferase involved in cell wall biosynthesis